MSWLKRSTKITPTFNFHQAGKFWYPYINICFSSTTQQISNREAALVYEDQIFSPTQSFLPGKLLERKDSLFVSDSTVSAVKVYIICNRLSDCKLFVTRVINARRGNMSPIFAQRTHHSCGSCLSQSVRRKTKNTRAFYWLPLGGVQVQIFAASEILSRPTRLTSRSLVNTRLIYCTTAWKWQCGKNGICFKRPTSENQVLVFRLTAKPCLFFNCVGRCKNASRGEWQWKSD